MKLQNVLRILKIARLHGGSDGIVGELLRYSGSEMVDLLEQLFSVKWQDVVPRQWREGLLLVYLRKGTGRTLLTTGVLACLVL